MSMERGTEGYEKDMEKWTFEMDVEGEERMSKGCQANEKQKQRLYWEKIYKFICTHVYKVICI